MKTLSRFMYIIALLMVNGAAMADLSDCPSSICAICSITNNTTDQSISIAAATTTGSIYVNGNYMKSLDPIAGGGGDGRTR